MRTCLFLACAVGAATGAGVGLRPARLSIASRVRGGERAAATARAPTLPRARARASSAAAPAELPRDGTMSVSASSVSLMKNIVGGGLLALPAGMAAAQGTGFAPAIGVCTLSAILSGYTYWSIGEAVQATGATDFKTLWEKTLGAKSSWIIDSTIICLAFSAVVMYGCFLGDLLSALVPTLSRTSALVSVTVAVLLPLALQRDLSVCARSRRQAAGGLARHAALARRSATADGARLATPNHNPNPYQVPCPPCSPSATPAARALARHRARTCAQSHAFSTHSPPPPPFPLPRPPTTPRLGRSACARRALRLFDTLPTGPVVHVVHGDRRGGVHGVCHRQTVA